jgi:prepilin-type N-terminal cleavage/methylation domain-containing protein
MFILINKKGFTLIELLLVIALLGIIAGIAIPQFYGIKSKAEISSLESNANYFRKAMEMHYVSYQHYPVFNDGDKLSDLSANYFGDLGIDFSGDLDTIITSANSIATSDSAYQLTLSEGEHDINVSQGGIGEVY